MADVKTDRSFSRVSVVGGRLKDTTGKHGDISMACAHRVRGACGGCYARLYLALEIIRAQPDGAQCVLDDLDTSVSADDARERLKGKRR